MGDEGGFAPEIAEEKQALDLILEAVSRAGYAPGTDIVLALDAAASEWAQKGRYVLPKSGRSFTAHELTEHWRGLCDQYPIRSIEDPLGEEDWPAWQALTRELGSRCQLVGDDLFVTNEERLQRGILMGCANAILLKPNQIGTLTETMQALSLAHRSGYRTIISHRSGETEERPSPTSPWRSARANQNGRALPKRAGLQIQPPAPHRGRARQRSHAGCAAPMIYLIFRRRQRVFGLLSGVGATTLLRPAGCGFAARARLRRGAVHDGNALRGAGRGVFRAESRPAAAPDELLLLAVGAALGGDAGRFGERALFAMITRANPPCCCKTRCCSR